MDNIATSMLHSPLRTGTSGYEMVRSRDSKKQPATVALSSDSGGTIMDVDGEESELMECASLAEALRVLEGTCTLAMLAADSRTTAPVVLELLGNAFAGTQHLRVMLISEGDNLLSGHEPPIAEITHSLERNLEALEYTSRSLHRHHGFAYMAEIVDRGDADQASQEMFAAIRSACPTPVRDEATEAGVQAIREIIGPLNEVLIALDLVKSIASRRNIDDVPF